LPLISSQQRLDLRFEVGQESQSAGCFTRRLVHFVRHISLQKAEKISGAPELRGSKAISRACRGSLLGRYFCESNYPTFARDGRLPMRESRVLCAGSSHDPAPAPNFGARGKPLAAAPFVGCCANGPSAFGSRVELLDELDEGHLEARFVIVGVLSDDLDSLGPTVFP
jgi:hypothetical protein